MPGNATSEKRETCPIRQNLNIQALLLPRQHKDMAEQPSTTISGNKNPGRVGLFTNVFNMRVPVDGFVDCYV
jgi:hypothetical protein